MQDVTHRLMELAKQRRMEYEMQTMRYQMMVKEVNELIWRQPYTLRYGERRDDEGRVIERWVNVENIGETNTIKESKNE